ncbi:hypothetical protein [Microvirga terrestris]|uniref:Uncharacterized protein n=1 Tax=Microvirga terrestris TaxID=2791024 RepID=A0ABS0HNW9_9HYPH|nr:hypothetical protein [Microvirga terrestris]MBF9195162.1 hypothetical protein [Microvirga terrestris]
MRKISYPITTLAFVCLSLWTAGAQEMKRDHFAGAPKGRLFLTIDLKGSGRKDLPNKVEWYRLTSSRKLELELAMLVPVKSPTPIVKVGGIDKNNAPMAPGMAAMAKVLEPCKGDQECQRKAMMSFGQQMMANPQAMGSMKQDDTRFENWMADHRGPCATGTLVVQDEGDGMNISPPDPVKPYRFKRTGRLELSNQDREFMDKVCQVEISVDRQAGLLSLRLKGLNIPVPVQMSGQAYTSEKSVLFLEGQSEFEVLDQNIDISSPSWTGQSRFEKAGIVSHNSGQTVAPMTGTLTWRFVRD